MAERLEKVKKYVETLDMPDWGYISGVEMEGNVIKINYCDMATIWFDIEYEWEDGLEIKENCVLGKWDVRFVLEVLENREEILSLLNK